MTASQDITRLVERCAYGNRMPMRSEQFAQIVSRLSGRELRRARAAMRQVNLPERMANRAAEISHFNPIGAIRIVDSMWQLFRPSTVLAALRATGYIEKQTARATRHQEGGNSDLAGLIFSHISELQEDPLGICIRQEVRLADPRLEEISPRTASYNFAGC